MESLRLLLATTSRWLVDNFGLPGLFLVAFLDSSFLSLPEVNDVLLVTLALTRPERLWVYALTAVSGSVAGCLALHAIGRHGGQPLLAARLDPRRIERLQARFRRFDVLAVLVPSLLPPPCPFKVFVLAAGVFGMRRGRFAAAVFIGRSLRYFGEAWLAVEFGESFLAYAREYAIELGLVAIACVLAVWLGHRILSRAEARTEALDPARDPRA